MEFEWDASKDLANQRKHNVSFIEAVETFSDPNGFQLVDKKHSLKELRYYWTGITEARRVLTTRFTRRGNKIRVIGSAEWRKFRELYYARTKGQ